jgi:membrane fusion protein, multidrug efflux system
MKRDGACARRNGLHAKIKSLSSPVGGPIAVLYTVFALMTSCGSDGGAKQPAQRVVPVKTGVVSQQNVAVQISAIGNVEAYNTVSVKALVGGEIVEVHFREGQDVRQGDLLFQIDPRPYEAALKQAEGALARDRAQAKNAEEQARRYQTLLQKDYVSRDQYDQLQANSDALSAAVQGDRANVENARLQLEYCTIKAPIDGRVGSVLINKGNVVKANDVAMVSINKVNPIYVTFSVPEQNLADIKKHMAAGDIKVEVATPGDEKRPSQGTLTFINNSVDATTGTIQLKGTFENRDRRLWPGQFVNVVMTLATERNAVVVPFAALQAGQQGQYVFVIKPDSTVESRTVEVARSFGDMAVISHGVTPGERVVTDGQLNLTPGTRVEAKNLPEEGRENGAAQQGKQTK